MTITLHDFLAQLPPDEQVAIARRTAELRAEEANLRQLREARALSQEQIARDLGIQQAAVSKLERRTDMYISTLRKMVRSLGGELEIIARFPGQDPIRISQFREELED